MNLSTRRQSRELALQVMFQQEFAKAQNLASGLDAFKRSFDVESEVWAYALTLLEGIQTNATKIDDIIQKSAAHWTLKRMALVDLNVMRIATFELKFADQSVPPAAVLNEAIEIARKFGTVDSASFVNGVLDQIMKH